MEKKFEELKITITLLALCQISFKLKVGLIVKLIVVEHTIKILKTKRSMPHVFTAWSI